MIQLPKFVAFDVTNFGTITRGPDAQKADRLGIALEVDVPPIRLWADGEMLWHVLSNLVNNAIKFRRNDARARISVSAASEKGTIRIRISDNGVGLTEKEGVFSP